MSLLDDLLALKERAANVRSLELQSMAQAAGYEHNRTRGGHHQFTKAGARTLVIPEKVTPGTARKILLRLIRELESGGQE